MKIHKLNIRGYFNNTVINNKYSINPIKQNIERYFCIIIMGIILSCISVVAQNSNNNKNVRIDKTSSINKSKDTTKIKSKNTTKKTTCVRFVDKDSDGINDNHCTGMGLRSKKKHGQVIDADSLYKIRKHKNKRKR